MNSSYKNNIDYKDIFSIICFLNEPFKIIEFGILDGYSLKAMGDTVNSICSIEAYDIFEEFKGNSANKEKIEKKFHLYPNISIHYGDFYKQIEQLENNSIDILHIDIANNGDVYEFVFNNYINKMKKNGIIIMEGGSQERDNTEWMIKYEKNPIKPVLEKYSQKYNIMTLGVIPSITIIKL